MGVTTAHVQHSLWERRDAFWTGPSPSQSHIKTFILSQWDNLELPMNLTSMFLIYERKPEYPEKTHACREATARPAEGCIPSSWAVVKAEGRPSSSITEQLLFGSHMVPTSAMPRVSQVDAPHRSCGYKQDIKSGPSGKTRRHKAFNNPSVCLKLATNNQELCC